MKVIIAGGRDFRDYRKLEKECDNILYTHFVDETEIEIVSGGQVSIDPATKEKFGADYYGEIYGKECGFPIKRFPADWGKFGNYAGPKRNKEMAEYASSDGLLIAFWDGKSRGTKNMIEEAMKLNLEVHIINY